MKDLFWYPGHELILTEIVRAENCYLYDSQGKRYVDFESGVWCTPLGHGHPRIARVIEKQFTQNAHTGFCYTNPIVGEAAREVLALLGLEGGRCVFLCSGSEAVEYGVRIAKSILDRTMLMTMADSYFGAYGSASQKQEDEWYCFDWMGCDSCPEAKQCDGDCERWAEIPFDRIGCFLIEPGSSSGLVRFPPVKLIRAIVEEIGRNDGLVLVNEVTTGIGRTGKWFGHQHYGVSPDIVAMGKGIGNGYPVSVTAFAPGVVDRLGDEPIKYAQSHQNDPLGAAVAMEVIRVIRDDDLIERGCEVAGLLMDGLNRISACTHRVAAVRGRGLMVAIELEDDEAHTLAVQVHGELVRLGFLVGLRPGTSVLRLDPSLTIDLGDIMEFLSALETILIDGVTC